MKCLGRIALIGVCAMLFVEGAPSAGQLSHHPVPPHILQALRHEHAGYRAFRGGAEAVARVPAERIPRHAKEAAFSWMTQMVRPQWLPERAMEKFIGERRKMDYVPPEEVDFICIEYARAGGSFSMNEGAGVLSVLWENPNIQTAGDVGKTAALLAQCLLRIPEEEIGTIEASLGEAARGEGKVFVGYLNVGLGAAEAQRPRGLPGGDALWHRSWYHQMTVWLADGFFYVSLPQLEGKPPENLSPRIGVPGQFLRFSLSD